jgi:hypothetical protein
MSQQKLEGNPNLPLVWAIDWADKRHVWSLQVASTGKREKGEVECVFREQLLAVGLEQSRATLLNLFITSSWCCFQFTRPQSTGACMSLPKRPKSLRDQLPHSRRRQTTNGFAHRDVWASFENRP